MKIYYAFMVVIVVAGLQGCAYGRLERQLDAKVASETDVRSRSDLGKELKDRVGAASALTSEQRSHLLAIRESTAQQMDKLTNESLRLRAVLIKDLVSTNYEGDEVELIKKRIREIEEKKVSTIFGAADQANQILGRDALRNKMMLYDLFEARHGRD